MKYVYKSRFKLVSVISYMYEDEVKEFFNVNLADDYEEAGSEKVISIYAEVDIDDISVGNGGYWVVTTSDKLTQEESLSISDFLYEQAAYGIGAEFELQDFAHIWDGAFEYYDEENEEWSIDNPNEYTINFFDWETNDYILKLVSSDLNESIILELIKDEYK